MADWLSEEWAEQAATLCSSLPDVPGANGTVGLSISVAPRKEVGFYWTYTRGRARAGKQGAASAPDLALTMAAADASEVLSGQVEPSVAYMRGRLKAAGDGSLLLGFLESTTSPGFSSWRKMVAGLAPLPQPAG